MIKNLFKSFMESDSENIMTESPENSPEQMNESNTLSSSFSDKESYNNALGSIKNKTLRHFY